MTRRTCINIYILCSRILGTLSKRNIVSTTEDTTLVRQEQLMETIPTQAPSTDRRTSIPTPKGTRPFLTPKAKRNPRSIDRISQEPIQSKAKIWNGKLHSIPCIEILREEALYVNTIFGKCQLHTAIHMCMLLYCPLGRRFVLPALARGMLFINLLVLFVGLCLFSLIRSAAFFIPSATLCELVLLNALCEEVG
jgi:hypothetical protein